MRRPVNRSDKQKMIAMSRGAAMSANLEALREKARRLRIHSMTATTRAGSEIGRASCRERVYVLV